MEGIATTTTAIIMVWWTEGVGKGEFHHCRLWCSGVGEKDTHNENVVGKNENLKFQFFGNLLFIWK